MPRCAAVLLLSALPSALAISSLTYEYAPFGSVDSQYESSVHVGHTSMQLKSNGGEALEAFAHHAYVVSKSATEGEQHTGSNTDREPEELCSETGGPKMCQHDTLYSHNNDRPLFLGMAGGQRFVPLLWADVPTDGREGYGSRADVPVRVTHVGLSCLESEKIDYEGTAYVIPIDVPWGDDKGAMSYDEFFPEPSVADVLERAVGLINKRSDSDQYDFSDQFQVKLMVEDWLNGDAPNYGFAIFPAEDENEEHIGTSVDALSKCSLKVTYEPRDRSKDTCADPIIVTVGTGIDAFADGGSGDNIYLQLIDEDGKVSAETTLASYLKVGDKTAAAGVIECGLGPLKAAHMRIEGTDALCFESLHVVHKAVAYNVSYANVEMLDAEDLDDQSTSWTAGENDNCVWFSSDMSEGLVDAFMPLSVAHQCVQPTTFTFWTESGDFASSADILYGAIGAKGGPLSVKRYLFSGFADGRAQSGPTAHVCASELFPSGANAELDRIVLHLDGDDLLVLQDLRLTFNGIEYVVQFYEDQVVSDTPVEERLYIDNYEEQLFMTKSAAQCDYVRDCNGKLAPRSWVGDGTCDQKARRYGIHYIDLTCEAFNYDNADCAHQSHAGETDDYYYGYGTDDADDDGTAIGAAARHANVTCDGGLYYCCDGDDLSCDDDHLELMPGCKSDDSCYGYSCDYWFGYDPVSYTCSNLESYYGCDCLGCTCEGDDACANNDGGAIDSGGWWWGDGCDSYQASWCGAYDDDDFSSNVMCCVCGGGTTSTCENTDTTYVNPNTGTIGSNGDIDPWYDSCEEYVGYTSWCGNYDDDDFSSMDMCCACGGGHTSDDDGATTCNTCSSIDWEVPEHKVDLVCHTDPILNLHKIDQDPLCPMWVTIDTEHMPSAGSDASVSVKVTGMKAKREVTTTKRVVGSGFNAGQRHVSFVEIECDLTELTSLEIEIDGDDAWCPSGFYLRYNPSAHVTEIDGHPASAWGVGSSSYDVVGLNSADADPTSLWMSADPTEGAKKRTFELMESSSFHNMLNDQPMKLATAAGISVGLLVALLVLFCITALTVIAVLRKLGKEDQIPEAIRATSAYTTLFPGMEDDDSPFSPSNSSSNPVADPSSIEMRVKDGPGTEL